MRDNGKNIVGNWTAQLNESAFFESLREYIVERFFYPARYESEVGDHHRMRFLRSLFGAIQHSFQLLLTATFIVFAGIAVSEEPVVEDLESKISPVTLVVAPPAFEQALQPWIEYRSQQGYEILTLPLAVVKDGTVDMGIQTSPIAVPEDIRNKIIKVAKERPVRAILIIGDGAPTVNAKFGWRDVVPAPRTRARVVQVFGSEESLAGDAFYADFDGDGKPDAPIGRIPAETPEELRAVIDKIIRYETDSPVGNWTRRINIIAGPNGLDLRVIGSNPGEIPEGANPLGGISSIVNSVVDSMARKMFSEFLPQEYAVSLTQFSLSSVFCPYPPDFGDVFLERANEGALFLVYLGHGQVFGLDRYITESGKNYGVFELGDCANLYSPKASPIACFFACYTGAYDAQWRSLAEEVALSPNGPVGVIAASRRTAPYGMCVLGASLLETAFSDLNSDDRNEESFKTLGDVYWLAQRTSIESFDKDEVVENDDEQFFSDQTPSSPEPQTRDKKTIKENENGWSMQKRDSSESGAQLEWLNNRLAQSLKKAEELKKDATFRNTIDRAAALLDPTACKLDEQVLDHIAEFNLLGDPLLRIKFPSRVQIDAPEIAYSTDSVVVTGTIPTRNNAEATVQAELLLADYHTKVRSDDRPKVFQESDEARAEYNSTYRAANNFVVDAVRAKTKDRVFRLAIKIPEKFSGECVIRIAAVDGERYYIGSKRILVRPKSRRD